MENCVRVFRGVIASYFSCQCNPVTMHDNWVVGMLIHTFSNAHTTMLFSFNHKCTNVMRTLLCVVVFSLAINILHWCMNACQPMHVLYTHRKIVAILYI